MIFRKRQRRVVLWALMLLLPSWRREQPCSCAKALRVFDGIYSAVAKVIDSSGSGGNNKNNNNDITTRDRNKRREMQEPRNVAADDAADEKRNEEKEREDDEDSNWLTGIELEEYNPPSMPSETARSDDVREEAGLDHLQLHPLLQIPCSFSLSGPEHGHQRRHLPIRTFCDTGATHTVMSWRAAQAAGLLPHLDRRYAGEAAGVGSCRVLGRIPAGVGQLNLHGDAVVLPSPVITILEQTGTADVELLLGLDVLREWQAVLNLREEELQLMVNGRDVSIPFIRPRNNLANGRGGDQKQQQRHCSRASYCSSDEGGDEDYDEWDLEADETDSIDMSGV